MFRNYQVITLDFETYFDDEYSLRRKEYNTSGYIRDSKFKSQCVAIKVGDSPVVWIRDQHIASALRSIDWSRSALLCHNTAFDGFILAHHYGVVPAYYLDTLSMARAIHSNSIRVSLDSLSRYYGVGNKLTEVLNLTKGIRDIPDDLMQKLGQYCAVDTELCYLIFNKMLAASSFPDSEFDLIDLTIRMFTQPVVLLDTPLVEQALNEELQLRQQKIDAAGVTLATLRSDQQLAEALVEAGLPVEEVPGKWSEKQVKQVWAFAKTDLAFQALKQHQNPAVRALAEGRIAAKTTYGESRALRFLEAGRGGRPWPILLNYCGAHTTRWTGGDKMNPQNLKRGGTLRKAVMAPPGHVIMACDSSQIEARVVAWLADHTELLQTFHDWDNARGPDVYRQMASTIYQKPIAEISAEERFLGKVVVLGAGYGMGANKFRNTLAIGAMGPRVDIPEELSRKVIDSYRTNNPYFKALWDAMHYMLLCLACGTEHTYKVLEGTTDQRIRLPNGLYLSYPGLIGDEDKVNDTMDNFRYFTADDVQTKENPIKIYGGLLTENVTQALARTIVAEQMLAISRELRVVTMTHDEVVCVVKESEAEAAAAFMTAEMRKAPDWCRELPLNAEVEYGERYG